MRRYTVATLNDEIDALLGGRYPVVLVEGEVAQVQQPAPGHVYLLLRDKGGARNQDCSLGGVVWKTDWQRFRYHPKVGDRVLCRGRLGTYAGRGQLQLYVSEVAPAGQGD